MLGFMGAGEDFHCGGAPPATVGRSMAGQGAAVRGRGESRRRVGGHMTLTSVLISLAVGILFVFVWGIFSYIASSGGEFKSYFIGGLANFLFFFGGVVSTYLAARGTQEPSVTAIPLASSEHNSGFSVLVALYIAGATTLAFLVMNLFSDAFTNSLERMRALGSLVFTQEGYRDAQVYFGGMIGFICLFLVIVYGLYLGAVRPYASYLSILAGVALSLGMQALLYWLFGMFSNYQVLRLVRVNSPEILGTYGVALRAAFGIAVTAMSAVFLIFVWASLVWVSVKLGGFVSRLPFP